MHVYYTVVSDKWFYYDKSSSKEDELIMGRAL